jgi:hypothetical protein
VEQRNASSDDGLIVIFVAVVITALIILGMKMAG